MSKTNGNLTISLAGKEYKVQVPRSFADREDLRSGWRESKTTAKSRRIFASTLALCIPEVAAMLPKGLTLDSCDCDLFAYGKQAYDALRTNSVSPQEIQEQAKVVFGAVMESLFPREDEVAEKQDFTEGEAPAT